MPSEFRVTRRVEFADTDLAGILHFSHYFRFMEAAEHAFLRSLGHSAHQADADGGMHGWVRASASCDYTAPLFFQDQVELQVLVREKRPKALKYEVVFRRLDPSGGPSHEVARGSMTVVFVRKGPGDSRPRAQAIPAEIDAALTVAPAPDHPSA